MDIPKEPQDGDLLLIQHQRERELAPHRAWLIKNDEDVDLADAATAHALARDGQWQQASALYCAILAACIGQKEYPAYDEGEYAADVRAVVDGAFVCLSQAEISADRAACGALVEQVAYAYLWDIENGGIYLGAQPFPDALLQQMRPEDIAKIRATAQAAQQRVRQRRRGAWGIERFEQRLAQLESL